MFQLLPCSRCQRTFSVRQEVSDAALLKCPNCGNQFRVGDVLDAFYSPWQVLEDPGTSAELGSNTLLSAAPSGFHNAAKPKETTSQAGTTEFSVGSNHDLEVIEEEHLVDEPSPGLSLDGSQQDFELAEETVDDLAAARAKRQRALEGDGEPQVDWSKFRPITHEEYQRMRRSQRSGIWSTLQIVLGGAAAIPVSLLLIWYVLDKDVAGAGPAVARYVPWIVPKQFRGPATAAANAQETAHSRPPRRRGESGETGRPNDGSSSEDLNAENVARHEDANNPLIATLDQSTMSEERIAKEDNASAPASAESTNALSAAEIFVLLRNAKRKVDDWEDVADADPAAKKEAALSLFEDLCALGVQLSLAPEDHAASELMRDLTQEISRAIKRQPDLVEVLHNAAKAQLNGTLPRSQNGWALVCTIGATQEAGGVWRVMVADSTLLPLKVPTIEIPKSVAPQIISGQRLLLLGRFVDPAGADENGEQSQLAAPESDLFRASFSYGL